MAAKKDSNKRINICACGKQAAPQRTICYTCKSREYTKKNRPLMVWHWIKKSAKKRHINFDLPKQEFFDLLFCSGYLSNSGRLRDSLTLDRIDGDKGYTIDNIRVITKSDNSAKYHDKAQEFPGQFDAENLPF